MLYAMWIVNTANISHYTMVFFCVTTTTVVARGYARTIRRLSDDLVKKNASLEKLDMEKDRFLAITSHELRTPLHGMIGLSESMLAGSAGDMSPAARENLSLMVSSGHRLAGMVSDLLDMARIQDGDLALNLSRLDLRRLCDSVIRLTLPLLGDRPVEIRNDISSDIPPVRADEERIRQVLHNLLGNAVRFTLKGSIALSARLRETSGDHKTGMIEISVSDTGTGVPDDMKDIIFRPWIQANPRDSRTHGGSGLGLAIAKMIIELHRGSISAAAGEKGGSVFTFTLPLWSGGVPENREKMIIESIADTIPDQRLTGANFSPGGQSQPVFPGKPVFLIVDDDAVNIRILRNYLEMKNCVVMTAADGPSALEIIDNDPAIDLVFLDIMMPAMSGFDVCRSIRLRHGPEELPVIMLTAKNRMADIEEAFGAGANDYMVKPFHARELLARTETMLRLKNIRKSASAGINIQNGHSTYSFMFREMIYITSHLKKIIIHTSDGDTEVPVMMKEIADRLPPDIFTRIHKSHIINIQHLRSLSHVISGRYRVRLSDSDDTELPVGPTYLDSLRKKITTKHSSFPFP